MMTRQTIARPRLLQTMQVAALFIAIAAGAALPAWSKTNKSEVQTETAPVPKQRVVSLTFKQMGAWSSVNLRGVDSSRTLAFSVRADEVVVAAKLRLAYDFSPSLIPELSHLRVLINERVAAVDALPQSRSVGSTREINLDPRMFGDVNSLRFNFIGHYTRQCEDPFHSSLWLTVSDLSRLELTLAPAPVVNDLRALPEPFFDKRDAVPLTLPFVFSSSPSVETLKAAGIVASWFGVQAGSRGAQFPVRLNSLPDGNAVVFMQGAQRMEGITPYTGATLSIQPHPSNPLAKLLLVTGGNEEELGRAARAIALMSSTLAGPAVTVTQEVPVAARKPYDAPAWIPTDRPVKFGELARIEEMRVQGYYPEVARLNYRVSPDVFTWRTPGTPLNLKYRYTRLPMHQNSSLNIGLNSSFVHALALNDPEKKTNETRVRATGPENIARQDVSLFLPPYAVGGRDQLQFGFYFDVIKEGPCNNLPPDNLQAAIDPESTIDFSGFPRYAALPNLSYFSNIGFPFTRMADLSETAVVLSDRPSTDELAVYLTLMGRMGEATAYPALGHKVVLANDVQSVAERDLLLIGSANGHSLMSKWADHLPLVQSAQGRRVREPVSRWMPAYRWEQQDVQATPASKGKLNISGSGNLAALMAFESPLKSARSVVLLYADKSSDLRKISDVLTDPERLASIQGDFAVVDDKSVSHAKVSETYYVGSLSLLTKMGWLFSEQPLLLGLLALVVCILLAAMLYGPARRLLAKRRKKLS